MIDLDERLAWFETDILPHQGALRARLKAMVSSVADVEDVLSETLVRAYAADGWSAVANGKHYMFRIARNILIDAARRDNVVSFGFVADMESLQEDRSTEKALSARDRLRHVGRIIDNLPPQCGRVFVLRRVHEYSLGEIAAEMGLSVSTVEKHLARAVMLLAKGVAEIEEWGVERERRGAEQPVGAR